MLQPMTSLLKGICQQNSRLKGSLGNDAFRRKFGSVLPLSFDEKRAIFWVDHAHRD